MVSVPEALGTIAAQRRLPAEACRPESSLSYRKTILNQWRFPIRITSPLDTGWR
jgi:hypothetical protein